MESVGGAKPQIACNSRGPQVTLPRLLAAFDLDGTLVNSWRDIKLALDLTLGPRGVQSPTDQEVQERVGLSADKLFIEVHESIPRDELVDEFRFHLSQVLGTYSCVFPGARETLLRIRELGWRTALATNKPAGLAQVALERASLDSLFDVVVGPTPSLRPKPAPDILVECLELTGSSEGLMIGDTAQDVVAGRLAGLVTVLVAHETSFVSRPPGVTPNHVVSNLREILQLSEFA